MKNIIVKVLIGALALLGVSVGGYQLLEWRTYEPARTVFSATTTASWGAGHRIDSYRNVSFMFSCTSSPTLTVKFAGSNLAPEDVDFTSAATVTNHWDYIQVIDLEDGSAIDGDTGISCAGSDDLRNFVLNTDLLTTVNAQVSSYTAGTTSLQIKYGTNQ